MQEAYGGDRGRRLAPPCAGRNALTIAGRGTRGPGGRPNVLLLLADQLGAEWLPAYGHPLVRAPNLDELAGTGVLFDNAYCPFPLCAPSRASIITGLLASRTEVFDNAAEMPASLPTLAHHLRASGYRTTVAGKMHFVAPDQLHGFEERLTTDVYPADFDWTPDWSLPAGERLPWYHTMEAILTPAQCAASMQMDYDEEVAFHATRRILDFARDPERRPFFLTVSFTHPHDPWELRPHYFQLYDPAEIELPAVATIPFEEADPYSRRLREMIGIDEIGLTDEQVRRARHGYFAAISYVDERIGEVLDALRSAGLEDDTIVVFTADHGEMLGERGLWYKMAFFDPSARVPLIVRLPGAAPRRVTDPVSLLDLVPTVLELTGEKVPADLDGVSVAPLVRGERAERGGPVLAEYLAEGVSRPAVMVRQGRWKFVHSPGDADQLYDLEADPRELENLGAGPEAAAFRAEVAARWDLEELERRIVQSQRGRHLVLRGLARGTFTAWDFQPFVDAKTQYVRSRVNLYETQRRARLEA